METIHIPEAEATSNFAAVLVHVRAGSEVVIESGAHAVAVIRPPVNRPGLLLSEILARAAARDSTVTLDGDFARDLEDAVNSHPEAMSPPEWD
ncbi:MAG: hypothetical protein ABSD43_00195 [Terracidiphilus sp.]|jgi:antitoxin (DNA-binding transcriptional repressor) of toxin-antitoxin stability system